MALAALIVRIGADLTGLNKGLTQADRDIQKLGRKLTNVGKDISTFVTLPIVALGAVAVRSATQLDSLTRGLTALTGSAEETDRQLVRLKEVAKLPGLGFKEAIQGTINLQAVGFSAEQAERSLMAFGNAIATTGGGKAELDRVFMQLTQMASAGKILTADLRPIIQVSPMVGRALKEAFGTISAEQINAMGLSFEQFYERLVSQLEKLPKVTGGAQNSFENLSDSTFRLSAAIGEGILPVILPLIDNLADLAERLSDMDSSTRTTILVVGGLVAAIGPLLVVIGTMMKMLPLMRVGFLALIGPVGLTIAAIAALTAAGIQMVKHWDAVKLRFVLVWAAMKDAVFSAIDGILGVLERLTKHIPVVGAKVRGLRADFERFAEESLAKSGRAASALESKLDGVVVSADMVVAAVKPLANTSIVADKKKTASLAEQIGLLLEAHEVGLAMWSDTLELNRLYDEGVKLLRDGNLAWEDRIKLVRKLNAVEERRKMPANLRPPAPGAGAGKTPGDSFGTKVSQVLQAGGGGSEMGQMVQAFASFGPMAAALPVINGALETLGPAFHKLIEPLVDIGRAIGEILAPVFEMLTPVMQLFANLMKALHPVLRVVVVAFSYVVEILGFFINAIGVVIDKLIPDWLSKAGKGLAKTGQDMIDAARAARKNTKATDEATEAVNKFASALSNIPRVLNINALRHMVTGSGGGGAGGGVLAPPTPNLIPTASSHRGGSVVYMGGVIINVAGGGDPNKIAEAVGRAMERVKVRGGTSVVTLAAA